MHTKNENPVTHDKKNFRRNYPKKTKYLMLISEPGIPERHLQVVHDAISQVLQIGGRGVHIALPDHPIIQKSPLANYLNGDFNAYLEISRHKAVKIINAERLIQIIKTHPVDFSKQIAFFGCIP